MSVPVLAGLKVIVTAGWWHCPDCSFRRFYQTGAGALNGAARHLAGHQTRLALPLRHHSGLLGGGR